jgi:hypothetical protein
MSDLRTLMQEAVGSVGGEAAHVAPADLARARQARRSRRRSRALVGSAAVAVLAMSAYLTVLNPSLLGGTRAATVAGDTAGDAAFAQTGSQPVVPAAPPGDLVPYSGLQPDGLTVSRIPSGWRTEKTADGRLFVYPATFTVTDYRLSPVGTTHLVDALAEQGPLTETQRAQLRADQLQPSGRVPLGTVPGEKAVLDKLLTKVTVYRDLRKDAVRSYIGFEDHPTSSAKVNGRKAVLSNTLGDTRGRQLTLFVKQADGTGIVVQVSPLLKNWAGILNFAEGIRLTGK